MIGGRIEMIKAKITKNIIRKSKNSLGISPKQMIIGGAGACTGVLLFFLLRNKLPLTLLMTIIFIYLAIVIFFGCIEIQGMNLFQYISKSLKGVDIRYYDSKGVFDNVFEEKK